MIVDLADRLGSAETQAAGGRPTSAGAAAAESRDALLAMGFSAAEVTSALKGTPTDADSQTMLKHALKRLGGGA